MALVASRQSNIPKKILVLLGRRIRWFLNLFYTLPHFFKYSLSSLYYFHTEKYVKS